MKRIQHFFAYIKKEDFGPTVRQTYSHLKTILDYGI